MITVADEKAAYDLACKRLLANKIILAWIMKSCVAEYRDIDVNEIATKYIEGNPIISTFPLHVDESEEMGELVNGISTEDNTINEGVVKFDIRFNALAPVSGELTQLIINVEAQNDFYPGYPIIKRAIYYCARMISSQYGTVFKKSHYEKIKKVYSIWICTNPPIGRRNSIASYSIKEDVIIGKAEEKIGNYDLITAIMICLGKKNDANSLGILKLLEVLLSAERPVDEKKKILEEDFNIKMNDSLEREVSTMCNLSKGVEEYGIQRGVILTLNGLVADGVLTVSEASHRAGMTEESFVKKVDELKEKQ
jgi:hypothetical protein